MNESHNPACTRPLSIAILHYACAPIVGGVESIISTHARLLSKAGHKPFIIAGRGDPHAAGLQGVIIPELDSRHPEITRAQAALLKREAWAIPEFERWVEAIRERLLEALQGVDLCVVHNAFTLHKNLALTVALARMAESKDRPRFVAWCHDLAWNNPLYSAELEPRWPWTPLKYALSEVAYVAISERRREEMATLFRVPPGAITLVTNGLDPGVFMPSPPPLPRIREQLRWNERDWVLLAPLRVTRRKNLELAIDIVAAMHDLGTDPLLVVTGPPGPHNIRSNEYMNELLARRRERDVEDHVAFLALIGEDEGFSVSDEMVVSLYWWADALLMPSTQEGFGLPLLEAGITRLPIFCSDIPVLREVGGLNANYFEPDGDPHEIARTILRTLRAPGPSAHRRAVLTDYSWDSIMKSRILPFFSSLLDEEAGDPVAGRPGAEPTAALPDNRG